ncbi:protealysin inhibitor emfourin [Homoserinimonas sp. OAct 916]|uniref:protealysin inhibitor emfourin n=1 Tax=Homoserinimonas sp. OAct 916 TaxID=2211450 RepID=UPI000DBE5590|nr:protealysin inhibitor emfourin [Homoserinimonas sp. OAct 916]
MKVYVSRVGGVAGIRLTWQVRVDDQPDADSWWRLLEDLPWQSAPSGPVQPDRFCYEIKAEPHEAVIAENELDGPWRELVDRVQRADTDSR